MDNWKGRVALVTGASAGIGAAIVKRLTSEGIQVVGCARNFERLTQLKESLKEPETFHPIQCNITSQEEVERMFAEIKAKFGGVDICINNAGLGFMGTLIDGDPNDWKKQFEVNVLGLSMCTKYAVASMRERDSNGYIIHINSMAGHKVFSVLHFYGATKFAVTALTEGLRQELRAIGSKIRASSISPGLVETEFLDKGHGQEGGMDVFKKYKEAMNASQIMQSSDVADAVCYLLSRPEHVQIHDLKITSTDEKFS